MHSLFQGPDSLRDPLERTAFWLTALCALPAALLIGYVLHESLGASQVALFIVIAMVYVTLARGRLLGSSVRVHERQNPRVFEIVKGTCAALEIPMPFVFVREDNYVPVAALGFGEPYALVLSSHWIELFRDDELSFMIGRELGHIAAGHTRFLSLLSVNGNENAFVSLIFGAWLRRCTFSCDKVGLLCCGSLRSAVDAIGVAAFHEFGRKVDYEAFAAQHAEIEDDSISRWGTWLGSEPYATARIAALRSFMASPAYASGQQWFLRERAEEPPALAAPGQTIVGARDCAGWWRRFAAFAIDAVVVAAIITSFGGSVGPRVRTTPTTTTSVNINGINLNIVHPAPRRTPARASPAPAASLPPGEVQMGPFILGDEGVRVKIGNDVVPLTWQTLQLPLQHIHLGFPFWFPVYLAILVIVAGQTFGMMIAGLRVVTTDFRRPGILRTIARYAIVLALWWLVMPLSFIWRRVLLHDRWTRTRVVKVERLVARAAGPN